MRNNQETTRAWAKNNPWSVAFNRIRSRCNNPNTPGYSRYGGAGIRALITVQELKKLWIRDGASAMEKPSIDRIDAKGDYTFENCRFIEHSINSGRANAEKTHCVNGHEFNADNTRTRIRRGKPERDCRTCRASDQDGRRARKYPLKLENVGEDVYCLMSKGHHDKAAFMAEVAKEYPSWPMGEPEHTWHRMMPDPSGEYAALYYPAEPGSRGAFPATWSNECYDKPWPTPPSAPESK